MSISGERWRLSLRPPQIEGAGTVASCHVPVGVPRTVPRRDARQRLLRKRFQRRRARVSRKVSRALSRFSSTVPRPKPRVVGCGTISTGVPIGGSVHALKRTSHCALTDAKLPFHFANAEAHFLQLADLRIAARTEVLGASLSASARKKYLISQRRDACPKVAQLIGWNIRGSCATGSAN